MPLEPSKQEFNRPAPFVSIRDISRRCFPVGRNEVEEFSRQRISVDDVPERIGVEEAPVPQFSQIAGHVRPLKKNAVDFSGIIKEVLELPSACGAIFEPGHKMGLGTNDFLPEIDIIVSAIKHIGFIRLNSQF